MTLALRGDMLVFKIDIFHIHAAYGSVYFHY